VVARAVMSVTAPVATAGLSRLVVGPARCSTGRAGR
jgi:hypothetical protein